MTSKNHSLVNLFSKISKLVMTDGVSNVQTYFKNDVDTHSFSYFPLKNRLVFGQPIRGLIFGR